MHERFRCGTELHVEQVSRRAPQGSVTVVTDSERPVGAPGWLHTGPTGPVQRQDSSITAVSRDNRVKLKLINRTVSYAGQEGERLSVCVQG